MPESDEPTAAEELHARRQPRSSMFLACVMLAGPGSAPAKIRNLSPNGALIETPVVPPVGTIVDLIRGSLSARGEVMWQSENRCGVRFSSQVSVSDWLKTPAASQQSRVDELVALVKTGPLPDANSRSDDLRPTKPRSREKLIDDLAAAISLIRVLDQELGSSHETLVRHAGVLQNLDIAVQMLGTIAAELSRDGS